MRAYVAPPARPAPDAVKIITIYIKVRLQLQLYDPGEVLPDCSEHSSDEILLGTMNALHAQAAQVGARSSDGCKLSMAAGSTVSSMPGRSTRAMVTAAKRLHAAMAHGSL